MNDGSRTSAPQQAGQQDPAPRQAPGQEMTIVGIGASAGGLTALKHLLEDLPENSGLSFVVVMHLSPKHESHLAELLQPHTRMPVRQVTETVVLEPDHIYVIPPNANLDTVDTHLRLSPLEQQRHSRAPIDHFLRTLSRAHDTRAIGVILSGTGSDGTLGLRRIKECGGLTIVQSPEEAEYDGMPRSAMADGLVDLVLPLREMPGHIVQFARTQPRLPSLEEAPTPEHDDARLMDKILEQVRDHTGHDFSRYKPSTVMRRIRRRMQLHHMETLPDYLQLLRERPGEAKLLFEDLLITVTEFFRDADTFACLAKEILPRLFEGKGLDDSLRVWSVGCSTGEEAYSLAMLLLEEAGRRDEPPRLQVFASDLHQSSLDRAREGIYPASITSDVTPERIRRFFVEHNGSYRVEREVREMIVFAPHNLLKDPPFSHVDLIVCRNLLIYLQRGVQDDVINLFHYALEPGGVLLLGSAETIDRSDLFVCESKGHAIYRRRDVPHRDVRLPVLPSVTSPARRGGRDATSQQRRTSLAQFHAKVAEQYAPPSILVSHRHDVVQSSATAGRYLQVPGGDATHNVFNLVREPLRPELRDAMHAAMHTDLTVRSKPVHLSIEGQPRKVVLWIRQTDGPDGEACFLVMFSELETEATQPAPEAGDPVAVRELQAELELTKTRLQTAIEDDEAGQEEMQASNEELQSANEELRSTLEELETSKEELQSIN
ncbi:MAG: chemotaxis protein CheB, partial [Planctomycetota bacterium]